LRRGKGIRVCAKDGADVGKVEIGIKIFKEVSLGQRFDDTMRNEKGLLWILKERVKGKPIDVSFLSTISLSGSVITSITSTLVFLDLEAQDETEGR